MTFKNPWSFNTFECGNCSLQSSCTAGSLVESIESDTTDQVGGIYDKYRSDIVFGIVDGEDVMQSAINLQQDLVQACERVTKVRGGLELALADMVHAQSKATSEKIEMNDRRVAVEKVMDELSQLPHATDRLDNEQTEDTMQKAAEDILRFSRQSLCRALQPVD